MKKFYKIKFVPHTHSFGPKKIGLKLEKSVKNFFLKIGQNYFFIKQSGYGEQTLFNKTFSFIIENISSIQ